MFQVSVSEIIVVGVIFALFYKVEDFQKFSKFFLNLVKQKDELSKKASAFLFEEGKDDDFFLLDDEHFSHKEKSSQEHRETKEKKSDI